MNINQIQNIITKGEGINTEFKTAKNKLNKDVFESICAFLNRSGGYLFLGVGDNSNIVGVDTDALQSLLDDFVSQSNNAQKLNPPFYLSPEVVKIENKIIVVIHVPESSQVHHCVGKIYDRNEDGDFDVTAQSNHVAQMYLRKQQSYSENLVFPYIEMSDFEPALFTRVRALVKNQRPNHPWVELSDNDLLKSAGLYKKDMQTNYYGYTLAAVLLFGTDELIQNVLPHHKTDAIFRVENIDRYDDRDDIRTNLIDSYERLMAFIAKHLPDKFYLDGEQRISIRDHLFREMIGNLLIHREFTNAFPAKLIIEKNRAYSENWNKPHANGKIDPNNFSPFPKNPMIAKLFKEIGWVEELGSGVRNTFKFCELYNKNTTPEFIEGDTFKAIIPLESSVESSVESSEKSSEKIIKLISKNKFITIPELSKLVGISTRAIEKQLAKLKKEEKLTRVGSTKAGHWKIL